MLTDHMPRVSGKASAEAARLLTPAALRFIARLEGECGAPRRELLATRRQRQAAITAGERPDFLAATRSVRTKDWRVANTPDDLQDRRVEITGPTDAKMVINALNSGANVFMADFEDANSPTWSNMLQGQANLTDAIDRTLTFTSTEGKRYQLNEAVATLMVRPRGWHLEERHVEFDGRPMSGSLFDFGVFIFHNAHRMLERGTGPYFYLPKLESHLEARLWRDAFAVAEDELKLTRGTIKCTVLIETILAAFEMDEILFELRDRIVGLNAGRWDYIFSVIKKFRDDPNALLPDRGQITMTVPFMRAYTELLVKTCHRRGAHAMGGMAAFIPSRRDANVNEAALTRVREDKLRESRDGFDGTWVAHPDLVPVARQVFDAALRDRPNQKGRLREDVNVTARDLLDFRVPDGHITEAGIRSNISVSLQYLEAWLGGSGAVAINNLMEDTATAEISRAQLWQWIHHGSAKTEDGAPITLERCRSVMNEERERIEEQRGGGADDRNNLSRAFRLLDDLISAADFEDFLTLEACKQLD